MPVYDCSRSTRRTRLAFRERIHRAWWKVRWWERERRRVWWRRCPWWCSIIGAGMPPSRSQRTTDIWADTTMSIPGRTRRLDIECIGWYLPCTLLITLYLDAIVISCICRRLRRPEMSQSESSISDNHTEIITILSIKIFWVVDRYN